jgi:phenylacetate-CoA ligase
MIASAWGWYLRLTRYGTRTEELVAAAEARDRWSVDRWSSWSTARLAETLHHAATHVPYYRDLWSKRRQHGDRRSWEELENWPVLSKAAVHQHPRAFIADGYSPRWMVRDSTSGTTGTPLTVWWTREAVQQWYALFELRTRRWYGVTRRDRWAMAGGQLVTPIAQTKPPFWVWNAAMHQLYLSSYHLAPHNIAAYLAAAREHRVRYLLAYSSSAFALAQGALELGQSLDLDVVVTNAEPIYANQREAIARAFRCPVRETYGLSEGVAAASECEHGSLHWWPDVGVIESLDRDGDERGDLVCTAFLNRGMPLIRYRTGDTGILASTGGCACGRGLPRLRSVEGRSDDLLITADGTPVGRLDTVFKGDLPIREAQIVQETRTRVRVLVVRAAGYDQRAARSITDNVRARMGNIEVIVDEVEQIPRTSNGKFRAVRSLLSAEERRPSRATVS